MNESPDTMNPPDAALEARLRAYFASGSGKPPDPEEFWQRLAPYLDPRATPTATAVSERRALSDRDEFYLESHSGDSRPSARGAHSNWLRRTVTTIGSLAAVVLICLAAVALFSQFRPQAGSSRIIRSGQLIWRQITLPPGVALQEGAGVTVTSNGGQPAEIPAPNATYQVAPGNGNIAYICETPGHATPRLWITLDAGQQWTRLPDLPTSATAFNACDVQIDANDARTVVVTFGSEADGAPNSPRFVFFDGASQWQTLRQTVLTFTSSHAAYFTIRYGAAQNALQGHLYISTDQMQSWRAIDAPLIAENLASAKRLKLNGATGVEHVWAQPTTGELLAQTYDGVLWRSDDSGTTWSRITLPPLPPASELTPTPGELISETGLPGDALVYVQQPVANHPFTLCALVLDQTLTVLSVAPLYCSVDSGKTWQRRPRTTVAFGNGKPDQFEMPIVMLADGSLLAWDVTTISVMAGNNPHLSSGHILGAIPTPLNPDSIPGGTLGVTTQGAVLWQTADPQTLYVAQVPPVSGTSYSLVNN